MSTNNPVGYVPGQANRLPSLQFPFIQDAGVRQALQAIAEHLEVNNGHRGSPLDQVVRVRDLIDVTALDTIIRQTNTTDAGSLAELLDKDIKDFTVPPEVTGLTAVGTLGGVILNWDQAKFGNYSHAVIYRATTDNRAEAIAVGTAVENVYTDYVGSGESYYYWVSFISTSDVEGPSGGAGILGQAAVDPTYVLSVLTGSVTETQLHADLNTRIDDTEAASVQATSDINGLHAQYTVKTDVNGHVAGYGLASAPSDENGVQSTFIAMADTFAITLPSHPWESTTAYSSGTYAKPSTGNGFVYKALNSGTSGASEPTWPVVEGGTVVDGGVTWEAVVPDEAVPFVVGNVDGQQTVGVNGALVVDGTITGTTIAAGTIGADKISVTNLAALSANMGSITAGSLNINNKFTVASDGTADARAITIRDTAGNIIMSSGGGIANIGDMAWIDQITAANISTYIASAAIDTAYITDAAIETAKINNAAVSTLKVAGNAITVPIAATDTGWYDSSSGGITPVSVSFNPESNPVYIEFHCIAGAGDQGNVIVSLYRDYVLKKSWTFEPYNNSGNGSTIMVSYYDASPGSGSHLYQWNITWYTYNPTNRPWIDECGTFAIGVKR